MSEKFYIPDENGVLKESDSEKEGYHWSYATIKIGTKYKEKKKKYIVVQNGDDYSLEEYDGELKEGYKWLGFPGGIIEEHEDQCESGIWILTPIALNNNYALFKVNRACQGRR